MHTAALLFFRGNDEMLDLFVEKLWGQLEYERRTSMLTTLKCSAA